MLVPPILADEPRRLERLAQLEVMDTAADAVLDRLTSLAATLTGMPIALVSLVDAYRQWWKSAVGLDQGGQTSRKVSFCGHAIAQRELFEVEDARRDPRFWDNPIVVGPPHVIHYAGMPLVMPTGERMGTICAIDHRPGRLDPHAREMLGQLGQLVVDFLLLRQRDRAAAAALAQAAARETAQRREQQQLEQLDRQKDDFLAMLSHELRNPLAPIMSGAHALAGSTDPMAQRVGGIVTRHARHMKRMVDDLMDVSRVTRGLVELHRQPVELRQVVQDAVEQVAPLVTARQHALHVETGDQPIPVLADAVRLTQVVANLLANAAKYTQQGGQIEVTAGAKAGTARLKIRDNGQGIAPDVLPHVFELFTQERRGRDRSADGLGLGLALVRSLVDLHGGTVEAHSPGQGQGAVFEVTLPLLGGAADLPARLAG